MEPVSRSPLAPIGVVEDGDLPQLLGEVLEGARTLLLGAAIEAARASDRGLRLGAPVAELKDLVQKGVGLAADPETRQLVAWAGTLGTAADQIADLLSPPSGP